MGQASLGTSLTLLHITTNLPTFLCFPVLPVAYHSGTPHYHWNQGVHFNSVASSTVMSHVPTQSTRILQLLLPMDFSVFRWSDCPLCPSEGYTDRVKEYVAHDESISTFLSHQDFASFLLFYTKEVIVPYPSTQFNEGHYWVWFQSTNSANP